MKAKTVPARMSTRDLQDYLAARQADGWPGSRSIKGNPLINRKGQ